MSAFLIRRFSPDWAWGTLGVGMATASATFAAYMVATAPAEVTGFGSKDFGIFAHFDKRQVAVVRPASPKPPGAPAPAVSAPPSTTLASAAIDREPTGSIRAGADQSAMPRGPGRLQDFKIRDVVGDHALIEHRSFLSLVRPGSVLAGAGEVLAIERQGGTWVVRTASGTIGGS